MASLSFCVGLCIGRWWGSTDGEDVFDPASDPEAIELQMMSFNLGPIWQLLLLFSFSFLCISVVLSCLNTYCSFCFTFGVRQLSVVLLLKWDAVTGRLGALKYSSQLEREGKIFSDKLRYFC